MNRSSKFLRNSGIFALGSLGSKIISFVMVPLYTYTLSKAEYGTVDIILTTVNLLIPLVTLNLFDAVFRFAMDKAENTTEVYNTGIWYTLGISTIALPIVLIVSFFLNFEYPLLFWLVLTLMSIFNLLQNYLKGVGQSSIFALNGIINTFLFASFNILFLVVFHLGVSGYLASYVAALSVSVLVAIVFGKVPHLSYLNLDHGLGKRMVKYSLPLIPNALSWWLTNDVSRYFILIFVGLSGNGLFAVANKIPAILNIGFSVLSQAWTISAIDEFNKPGASEYFSRTINRLIGLSFVLQVVIVVGSRPLLPYVIASSYESVWKYVPFLVLSATMSNINAVLGSIYIAAKKTAGVFSTTFIGMLVNVLGAFFLTKAFGINGTSFSSFLGFFVIFCLRVIGINRFLTLQLDYVRITSFFVLFFSVVLSTSLNNIIMQYIALVLTLFVGSTYFVKK